MRALFTRLPAWRRQSMQVRALWHDPRIKSRKQGHPIISGSTELFVSKEIPVVLISNVNGVGQKGQIVNVKRGHARHCLVPQGLAAYATLWENIDRYADPSLITSATSVVKMTQKQKAHTFDWVNDIQLDFVRDTDPFDKQKFIEPVTAWCLLEQLSQEHQLDLLPHNLSLAEPLSRVGAYDIACEIMFKGAVTKKYSVAVQLQSQWTQLEEQRRGEMQRALQEKPSFLLARNPTEVGEVEEEEEDVDDDAHKPTHHDVA
eukprot:GEMP01092038.1.p1 GENE.GEMP01092038.1~~GEMP01092038.1.p1  ORF type:complete len:260 (+),score=51.68 GEMP01092038.1:120-899(+)